MDAAISGALEAVISESEVQAKALAPVKTGALRDSIVGQVTGNQAVLGASVPYADDVELGDGKRAPRPFIGPVADRWEKRLPDEIKRRLR